MKEMLLLILGMLLGNISRGDLDPYKVLFDEVVRVFSK
jgi:hypothetical protein